MKQGIFCLSFDVEGDWGRRRSRNVASLLPLISQEMTTVEKMVSMLNARSIVATWAIVGALFEINKNLIHHIEEKGHEIASHSMTHPDFFRLTREQAMQEIRQCITMARRHNIRLSSFIYPYNHVKYLDILTEYGFNAYRKPQHRIFENHIGFFLPRSYRAEQVDHVISIPQSLYLPSNRGVKRLIPKRMRFVLAKKGIDEAVSKGEIFHLWTHPIDFIDQSGLLLHEFAHILTYAGKLRSQGKLAIQTMAQIARVFS